ncbi:MAG: hypothetical protein HDS65_04710, partial [Bacteroidales bacterium]|nr:hypothetical protein [Bacteroidales bacterium]
TLTVSRTSAGNYLYKALYYDDAGRAVQERTIMPDATLSHSSNYTYAGAVKDESYTATLAGKNHSFSLSHTYDDAERPHGLKATLKDSVAQTTTGYGRFGMPIITYYGKNCWQHLEYTDQGWLKKSTVYVPRFKYVRPGNSMNLFDSSQSYYRTASIDSVYLGFIDRPQAELWTEYTEELFYADAAKPCYSGVPGARKLMKGGRYDYTYDKWSRLTEAKYTPEKGGDEDYSVSYSYDELGRPLTIKRSGILAYDGATPYYSTIDNMALSYDGATLKSVTDKTDYWSDEDLPDEAEFYGMVGYPGSGLEDTFSYSFNAEGLLTYDKARRLSNVMYDNFGNLQGQTREVSQKERYEERFEYAPDGSRLRCTEVHIAPGSIGRPSLGGVITPGAGSLLPDVETGLSDRRYIGPFTFNADTLERVDFPGGFFDHAGRAFYMVRDWNSSVAMVVDAEGEIRQHTGYYPYGEPWAEPEGQPYLYAGKERMRFLSKGDSDFGPRAYNAAIAQWWAPDALASETPWFSPYTYCGANPNRYSDLSGNRISCWENDVRYTWECVDDKWDFYYKSDDNGWIAYSGDGFVGQVRDALNYLMQGETGRDLVTRIAENDRAVRIYRTTGGSGGKSNKIEWNPKGAPIPTKPRSKPNGMVDLGHEIAHVDYSWNIETEEMKELKWADVGTIDTGDSYRRINIEEVYTTHIENLIRAEHGLNLRTHYVGASFGASQGQIVQGKRALYVDINGYINYKNLRIINKGYEYYK